MNKVILCGRLTRDPEVRYNQDKATAKFSLAVERKYHKDGEQAADFINCVAFGKTAEFAEKYLHKGTKIITEGRWQTGNYKNKDGITVYTNDCIVEQMEFAESKQDAPKEDKNNFMDIPDGIMEDLPFN